MDKEKLFQLAYDPKKDITVWELARVIALNLELQNFNRPIPQGALEQLEPDIRRHYKEIDVTEQFEKLLKESKQSEPEPLTLD